MRSKTAVFVGAGTALLAGALMFGAHRSVAEATPNRRTPKPEVVELGRRLFMDPTVSRLGRHSCASCHDPERAFGDVRRFSPDDAGPTRRHSQTLVDLTGEGFHWDGEFQTVRQLLVARVAPAAMANLQSAFLFKERLDAARRLGETTTAAGGPQPVPGTRAAAAAPSGYGFVPPSEAPVTAVADRLAEDGRYAEAFKTAFGTATPTTERVLDAMDAFCASIRSGANAFDRFVAGDDAALSPAALRGLVLFEGRAGCAGCHVTTPSGGRAPFTDGSFHDTGVAYHSDPLWRQGLEGPAPKDTGRAGITFVRREVARFKTPTLRDVAVRAPYMHDASFATLTDVVRYYSGGGTRNPNLDPAMRRLDLSEDETADLVHFLESLTGSTRAGLGFPARHAAPLRVRVEDLSGDPIPGFTLAVAASGDRLLGAETVSVPAQTMTDAKGEALIERPLATHVLLSNPAFEVGLSRPIPDSCETQTLIATPNDAISLRVRRADDGPALPREIALVPAGRGLPMRGCGPAPVATLTKVRTLGTREALYAGKAVAKGEPQRCALVFDDGATTLLAEIDLGGGASETIFIERASRSSAAPLRSPPGSGDDGGPNAPGEDPPHGTDQDRGARDVGDRR